MRIVLSLLGLFLTICYGQTLNVPARPTNALEGSQVVDSITNLSLEDREIYIMNQILQGNIPDFQRNMILVEDSALITGSYVHVEYYVVPDYLALGSDTNYYLCPMTPILGQRLADTLDCILPTRKMVGNIWNHASVKMTPESIPPSPLMTTVPVMSDHNDMVWTQRQTFLPGNPLGELVSGNKKDVVLSNLIYDNAPPARVVIYGWHYPSGTNIQPLYAGHIDTYADYSHGIRLIQKEVYVDGTPMDAETILASSNLHTLLSDEGLLSQPFYPDTTGSTPPPVPDVPKSFCVLYGNGSIDIEIAPNSNVDAYEIYLSTDGTNFSFHQQYNSTSISITGLPLDSEYFVKLIAENSSGTSSFSEVLGATTSITNDNYLIVNGFDRASTGNTYDFVRQHGNAIWQDTISYSSATNDAVLDGLVLLEDYPAVDYILGEESTVDETFDYQEQDIIEDYLDGGGNLFVSGAEIGWDLEDQGSPSDGEFYNNYLKAFYIADAPGGISGQYYNFHGLGNGLFDTLSVTSFDDGTNGTYDVNYPDVIVGATGGIEVLGYEGFTNQYAGIYFEGPFPGASLQDTGKIVHLGFPFETIYPESKRFAMMSEINDFFFGKEDTLTDAIIYENINKIFVYPNPTSGLVFFSQLMEKIELYSLDGKKLLEIPNAQMLDLSNFSNGVYLLKAETAKYNYQQKIIKQ